MLESGKTAKWGDVTAAIERALNSAPHSSLGWLSPFQVFHGADVRQTFALEEVGFEAPSHRTARGASELAASRAAVREANATVGGLASEAIAGLRAMRSECHTSAVFDVGSYVLAFAPSTAQNSLQSKFAGPFRVVARGVAGGVATGFYLLRECLPGHDPASAAASAFDNTLVAAPSAPVEAALHDRAISRHASDLKAFDWAGQRWDEILSTRLPEGYGFVTHILKGPDDEGRFEARFSSGLVQWLRVSQISRDNIPLKIYLASKAAGAAPVSVAIRSRSKSGAAASRAKSPSAGAGVGATGTEVAPPAASVSNSTRFTSGPPTTRTVNAAGAGGEGEMAGAGSDAASASSPGGGAAAAAAQPATALQASHHGGGMRAPRATTRRR